MCDNNSFTFRKFEEDAGDKKYLLKADKSKEETSLEKIRNLDSEVKTEFAGNQDIIGESRLSAGLPTSLLRREMDPPFSPLPK